MASAALSGDSATVTSPEISGAGNCGVSLASCAGCGSAKSKSDGVVLAGFGAGAAGLASGSMIRFSNVRNSRRSNTSRRASTLISERRSSCSLNSTGASVTIVARNFENFICSALLSTFARRAPFIWSVLASRFSTEPNCAMSFSAVTSPTPGHPGMLSTLSPISASRSITWRGDLSLYRSHTSSTPRISNSPPL